ncbi:hypothetical protein OG453_22225 [Streptomyces sp. NBC_01381]|uniref:hypothetical protein n=1 Tax=Streptomyces sp. NBC_01381 TaxID=2903845 RepID=UPI00224F6432|nr:hypothetical protein [Streptomyces sp. NBC_01381]MCX4669360.1 hypothetical protein [Streptomyces sp. NBC_01381]
MSKARMALISAAAVGATAFAGPAAFAADTGTTSARSGSSAAAACANQRPVTSSVGKLYWKVCTKTVGGNKYKKVYGTLKDTRANGKPVYGKILFKPSNHSHTYKTYGTKNFDTGWHKATKTYAKVWGAR